MKHYIGTKIIKAEPMDEITFLNNEGKGADAKGRGPREGYRVKYPDGYVSWSPKDVFESAYRLISEEEFGLLDARERSEVHERSL